MVDWPEQTVCVWWVAQIWPAVAGAVPPGIADIAGTLFGVAAVLFILRQFVSSAERRWENGPLWTRWPAAERSPTGEWSATDEGSARWPRRATPGRLAALLVGPSYLVLLGGVASAVTGVPFASALLTTAIGAAAVMVTLGAFALKYHRRGPSGRQFSLLSIMLLFVLFAVYLGWVRWVWKPALRLVPPDFRLLVLLIGYAIVLIGFTSFILLWWAEALVWLATVVVRWLPIGKRSRRNDRRGGLD